MPSASNHARARIMPPSSARSLAIVCRNLAREESPLLSIGRFELISTLGRGGNGVVYDAFDPERQERVALKTLHERGPSYLYRLKREFRALARLQHPGLVALHELFASDTDAYFTMELVAGIDLQSYVHKIAPAEPALEQLRDAFLQLCEGVNALHRSGTLHRDLKPSNVLVTDASRVVLLDFGLASDARQHGLAAEGTRGYMAPEQALGAASTASDWFSLGCMLRQALATLVKAAPPLDSLHDTRRLRALAEDLAKADATARPSYSEIVAALRGTSRATSRAIKLAADHDRGIADSSSIIRPAERAKLTQAFERSRTEPVMLVVRGEAGVGKRALLAAFASALETASIAGGVLVLRGRCYERESLPYKGLDSAIDELSRALIALPGTDDARKPLPDGAALVALFPVLGRVTWLMEEPATEAAAVIGVHPLELRSRGFTALRVLLARIAKSRALVMCLEDMQWSDADSGRLLGALLSEEGAPNLLVLATDRSERLAMSPALDELQKVAELAPLPVCVLELELEPRAAQPRAPAALDLRALRPASIAILKLMALAARPLPTRLVAAAAGLGIEHHAHIKSLRAAKLLRTFLRGEDEWIELEHGCAAEVAKHVGDAERAPLHRCIIRALQSEHAAASELLIAQYAGAGEHDEAARCAELAADDALAGLAFSRAARLYELALSLGASAQRPRGALHGRHAIALTHAGRGIEAAEAFHAAAAATADPFEAVRLEQRAADQWMRNGDYAQGEASLARVYGALGLSFPKGRLALVLAIARVLAPSSPWRRRSLVSPELRRLRAELLAASGGALESYDGLRSLHNALLCCAEAEQLSDPQWQARARGSRALMRSMLFAHGRRGLSELERASAAAAELGDPTTQGEIDGQLAIALFARGRSRAALAAANRSAASFRLSPLAAPQLHGVLAVAGSALLDLGRLREARRHWHALTHAARSHGDLITVAWVHTHPVQLAALFATQERARSQAILDRTALLRAAHPRYFLVSWAHAACSVEHAAYWGAPHEALEVLQRERAVLFGAQSWALRNKARLVRARAMLLAASALATTGPDGRARAALLRRAWLDALRLRAQESPLDRGIARLLSAGVAAAQGRRTRALAHLTAARALFDEVEARLLSAAASHCTGSLLGGERGAALQAHALAAFVDEGVVDPRRYIAWIACGFPAGERGPAP